jgi:hypothetical protein
VKYLSDILIIGGAISITGGTALISIPGGCIVGGLFMLGFAGLIAWTRGTQMKDGTRAT